MNFQIGKLATNVLRQSFLLTKICGLLCSYWIYGLHLDEGLNKDSNGDLLLKIAIFHAYAKIFVSTSMFKMLNLFHTNVPFAWKWIIK